MSKKSWLFFKTVSDRSVATTATSLIVNEFHDNRFVHIGGVPDWQVNVSHTGAWILLAIRQFSVDVVAERINPDFAFRDLMMHSFSQKERADAQQLFYRLWTRKEALVKAVAEGYPSTVACLPRS
ncbi:4'-phosphopantetheinyl transferase family protein [Spirosoma areae]